MTALSRPFFDRRRGNSRSARLVRACTTSALGHWIGHDVLMGSLHRRPRAYALLIDALGTFLLLGMLLILVTHSLIGVSWALFLAMTIGAVLLEGRMWGLADYGFGGEAFGYIITLLGLIVLGPAAAPIIALPQLSTRHITHPHQAAGRIAFNSATNATAALVAAIFYQLAAPVLNDSLPGILLAFGLTAVVMETTTFLLALPIRVMTGGASLERRFLTRDLIEVWRTAPVYALAIFFLERAWSNDGIAGVLVLMAALLVPIMINLAPAVDAAWYDVRIKASTQRQERSRQSILAAAIVDRGQAAYRDELTGLANRFRFDEDLAALEAGSGEPQMLVLSDVVGLKSLNDSQTHQAGDALLRAMATGMRSALRDSDRVYRLGGDEFAAIMPMVPPSEVERVLTRIRRAVRLEAAHSPLLTGIEVKVRFGWAATIEGGGSLYARADATLTARHRRETDEVGLA